jgi:hypothetical protein
LDFGCKVRRHDRAGIADVLRPSADSRKPADQGAGDPHASARRYFSGSPGIRTRPIQNCRIDRDAQCTESAGFHHV